MLSFKESTLQYDSDIFNTSTATRMISDFVFLRFMEKLFSVFYAHFLRACKNKLSTRVSDQTADFQNLYSKFCFHISYKLKD